MKKVFWALFAAAFLSAACGKEEKGNDSTDNGGHSPLENVEINEISLPVPKLILSTDHTDGKILLVSLDPADASTQLLKVTLNDDSVVSWSIVGEGILFKPKIIGSTQVTIGAKSGPAASVKATVQVVSPEDYADVEIQTIALTGLESGNELSLNLADEAGKTIGVTLDPKEASLDMLKISAAPTGIAEWQLVTGGIRFKPVKKGETVVTIAAKSGPAASKKVNIRVLEQAEYSDYDISSIKVSPAKVELDDQGSLASGELTLTLDPSAANSEDLRVSSSNTNVVTVEQVKGTKKLKLTAVSAGSATISLRPIKGSGSTVTVPVTVYGHITGLNVSTTAVVEGVTGDSEVLGFSYKTTGTLRTTPAMQYDYDKTYFSLNSDNSSVTFLKGAGAAMIKVVTAKYGEYSAKRSFLIYDLPTGVSYTISGSAVDNSLSIPDIKLDSKAVITWSVLPTTAKQGVDHVSVDTQNGRTDYVSASSSLSGGKILTTISADHVYHMPMSVKLYPLNYLKKPTSVQTVSFSVVEYLATEVKPGDYVYYNSSDKRFYWSDGGVRIRKQTSSLSTYFHNSLIRPVPKNTSLGTYIGQVYDATAPTGDAEYNKLTKPGFANKNGAHARVVSAKLAYESGESAETWKWTSDPGDVGGSSNWKINDATAPSQSNTSEKEKDYSYKLALFWYNIQRGSSYDIRPAYVVNYFDNVTFGVTAFSWSGTPSWSTLSSAYSSLGHSGWMLPSYQAASDIVYLGIKVLFSLEDSQKSFWTCIQDGKSNAYKVSSIDGSLTSVSKTSTDVYIRPILWL